MARDLYMNLRLRFFSWLFINTTYHNSTDWVIHHGNQRVEGNYPWADHVGSHQDPSKLGNKEKFSIPHWDALFFSTTTEQKPKQANESVYMP